MKLPYSWLKELSGADWSIEDMEDRLTRSGTAGVAEQIKREHFEHVVVGQITKLGKHPNADKLLVAEVDSGSGSHTVICGAPNCAVGQKVILALPGARLKGELEIKEIKMRGVKSAGMICAEDEIGLSDDHSGIMVLDDDAPLGEPVFDYLSLDDAVFNFEITPNRPDCLSAVGVAREITVLDGREFHVSFDSPTESKRKAADYVKVVIDDPDACPRYAARIIDGVKIGQSPWWLRKRLMDCGVRPINTIVDITNLVMLETGHPLHAFDYDRFGSKEVVVRRAAAGEKFTTLDGKEHTLDENILLITNGTSGVAAAGVMGGLDSEVEDDTRMILLEAAYFDPGTIRRSARKLGLSSESSYRFERGVNPNGVIDAADRAAALMAELAGGEVLSGVVDNYAKKITPVTIEFRPAQVSRLLGVDVDVAFIEKTFRGLGIEIESGDTIKASAPTYRPDLTREVDLVEEVGRIYGLDKIPNSINNAGPLLTPIHRRDTIKDDLRDILTGLGFDEALTTGMGNRSKMEAIDPTIPLIEITNPLSDEFMVMRSRMLYSLLLSTGNNIRHRNMDLGLFEIGRVFRKGSPLPTELITLGIIMTGRPDMTYWKRDSEPVDLFDLKGAVQAVTDGLGVGEIRLEAEKTPGYIPLRSYRILIGDATVGVMGQVDKKAAKIFDIKQDCFAAELDCERLIACESGLAQYAPLPKFPASSRDIALVVDKSVRAEDIHTFIRKTGGDLVESVTLFDLFTGQPVPEGKKSLAYAIQFRSPEKTLEDDEVDRVYKQIVAGLEKNFDARLRE